VSNTERTGAITGKISATPNPIPFGQGYVLISWETNDPSGGEIRVATSTCEEKLVTPGEESLGALKLIGSWTRQSMSFAFIQPAGPTNPLIR
jgi:hypothetical protein